MDIIQADHSAHWYCGRTGLPMHRVPYADKKRKDETRPTTLKDAKSRGLYPSTTSILSIINKPGLEVWKLEQCLLSALTLPRLHEEMDDQFAKRVAEDMKVQVRKAADRGTKIHRAIERYLNRYPIYLEDELVPCFEPVMKWLDAEVEEVIMAEQVLMHQEEQYAGTVDLIAILKSYGPCIVDFKTKSGEASFYLEWNLQLSSYRAAYFNSHPKASPVGLLSVVVASQEPRPVEVHQWPEEDAEATLEAFNAAHTLFRFCKSFPKTPITPLDQF